MLRRHIGAMLVLFAVSIQSLYASGNPSFVAEFGRVLGEHSLLNARRSRLAAALARARATGRQYPDPMLGIAYVNAPYNRELNFKLDGSPMSGIEYRLTQPVPFPGRLTLKAKIADNESEIARLEYALARNDLAEQWLLFLREWQTTTSILRLSREYEGYMRLLEQSARARYATGAGNLSLVALATLKAGKYRQMVIDQRGRQAALQEKALYFSTPAATLAALSKPAEEYILALARDLPTSSDYLSDTSLAQAMSREKDQQAGREINMTRLNYGPDMEVFAAFRKNDYVEYSQTTGVKRQDYMSAGVRFRVPLWSALSTPAETDSKKKDKEMQEAALQEIAAREKVFYQGGLEILRATRERIRAYKTELIPSGRANLNSSRLAYETGALDLALVLEARDILYKWESELLLLELDYSRQALALAKLANRILPESNKEGKS
jgi:outer membrane protein TolC